MDKLNVYQSIIKNVLGQSAKYKPSHGEIESVIFFDDERQSYQLMLIGWDGSRRIHNSLVHIRLRDEKVWVEYDGTHEGIATHLLKNGIPKEDIVLGFQAEWKRPFTDFAIT